MPSGIKIGDVFMAMLLDSRDFQASAAKEGQKAGDTAGAAMSKGIKGRLTDLFKGGIFAGAGIEIGRQALHGLETAISDVINVIPDMLRKGEDFGLNVEDITKKTGASAESASRFVATLTYLGQSTDGLGMSLKTLSVQVVNNEAEFDKLGIKVRTSANGPLLDTITILDNVRSYMSKSGSATTNLALATTLLGKSAGNLIEYLDLTDAQAAALNDTFDALGVTMSERAVQDIQGATRESRLLGLAWQGLSNVLTAEVVPTIRQVLGAAFQFIVQHGAEVRQTLVDITNAALGLVSGLLGIEGVTPFQAQLDGLAGSSDNVTLSFDQWAQQMGYTVPVIDKTAGATKAATGAIDNEIKSIDKQTDRSKAADTAAENAFKHTMTRLGAVYQAQLDALDLQDKQDAAAQRAFDLNERLNQAQLDLAVAQAGDKGVVDAKAVSDAMKAVADIRAEQAKNALQQQRDDQRASLQSTKDYIAEQATLASDTTVTQTTKVKTFTHREDVLTSAINVAKEKGDAATVADLTARLEAVKTAKARTEQANRAIDRQAELGDIKAQLEAQKAAIASADSAEVVANKKKLAELTKEYKTYLADQKKTTKDHIGVMENLVTGDPKTGTGLGGALTKAFTDGQMAGEAFRKFLDERLFPALSGVLDVITKIAGALTTHIDTETVGSLLGLAGIAKLVGLTSVPGALAALPVTVAGDTPPDVAAWYKQFKGMSVQGKGKATVGPIRDLIPAETVDQAIADLLSRYPGLAGMARAGGGPAERGMPYIVGEKRPEVFVPDENGSIIASIPEWLRGLLNLGTKGYKVVAVQGQPYLAAPDGPFPGTQFRAPTGAIWASKLDYLRATMALAPRAGGGPAQADMPYLVGERRPEVFVPTDRGTTIPSIEAMRGWTGGAQTIEVPVYLDGEVITRVVSRHLADEYHR